MLPRILTDLEFVFATCRIPEIVSDSDLKFLIDNLDEKLNEDEKWENDKPLKYPSKTVCESCSLKLLRDFYMDNDYRKLWDKTVIDHVQLQDILDLVGKSGKASASHTYLTVTKKHKKLVVSHWSHAISQEFFPRLNYVFAQSAPSSIEILNFLGRGIKGNKGSLPGRDASEIRMFHQEDAGLNVEMAKLAFAKDMWSYVCKMDNALRKYSAINRSLTTPSVLSATLIQKVPPELDMISGNTLPAVSASMATLEPVNDDELREKKLSRIPSKKTVAKSLLVAGGVICLSRGHTGLGAKVAMLFILTKLRKHCDSSSRSRRTCT
ncbi:hypothetical protein V6N12_039771 [Hibiscus sabdariffa]|uniref:START domain-containing protein n=1 Tax=Hibiscus sabdariffa TaxID=183260 RepID=A0ABR2E5A3_9ROSI